MTESPRRDEPTQRIDGGRYGYTDPAYAGQTPYVPRPTEPLPAYPAFGYDSTGQYGAGPYGSAPPPEPPEPPGTPRWLWIVAGIAVVTVVGLVIALVIVNSSQQQTVVAPVPTISEQPSEPTVPTAPPTTTRRPTPTTSPRPAVPPATPPAPSTPAIPGATEPVTYDVTGQGRAINVTYVDNGGILQTEFNVMLPWSKTVALAQPATQSASVSIINVGRQVSCSITIGGATVRQRTGSGLTICSPIG